MSAQLNNPKNIPFQWKLTDTLSATVDLSEFQVVLPRNSFPAIDYPKFISRNKGLEFFFNHEPVISVAIGDQAKAYPLNMLTMHEISNDTLSGIPILPTYCPLCNSSMVFDRRLNHNGKNYLLEFEVSGMLRNSDMVMADTETETWWQQLMGEGLVGALSGAQLTVIPSQVISVEDFFKRYPNGLILSPKTGTKAEADYGKNPYTEYDKSSSTPYTRFFDEKKIDNRLKPMERILDIQGIEKHKIYPFTIIARKKVINDTFDGKELVIFFKKGTVSVLDKNDIRKSRDIGSATVYSSILNGRKLSFKKDKDLFIDQESKSVWDITGHCISGELKGESLVPIAHGNHFAFAWLTFYPDSIIYDTK